MLIACDIIISAVYQLYKNHLQKAVKGDTLNKCHVHPKCCYKNAFDNVLVCYRS